MGTFDLKGSSSNSWNYSNNQKEGYQENLTGTVVEISNPQVRDFQTKQPVFWPDGNPKRNICVTINDQTDGQDKSWYFAPKSIAANAVLAALDPQGNRPNVSIEEILGKQVSVSTAPGVYNNANPRPWVFQVLGDGNAALVRGMVDLDKQQPQQQAAPAPQPQAAPNPQLAHAQQQAAQALGFQQPVAAPQVQGAVAPQQQQVQPMIDAAASVYDSDIPF